MISTNYGLEIWTNVPLFNSLAKSLYFTNLDFPEIRGPISLPKSDLLVRGNRSCDVAIIWPEIMVWKLDTCIFLQKMSILGFGKKSRVSFFQVTLWSPKWWSLSPWEGHLKLPNRSLHSKPRLPKFPGKKKHLSTWNTTTIKCKKHT